MDKVLTFHSPQTPVRALLSLPHSGEWIAEEFLPHLKGSPQDWAQDVDAKIDQLISFQDFSLLGVALLQAHIHRITIDLNRSRDIALFAWPLNTLGVPIVKDRPHHTQEEKLLSKYYDPYYEILTSVCNDLTMNQPHKKIPAVDLHSMPSQPTTYHLKQNPHQTAQRADFCLSDFKGTTCPPLFIQRAKHYFEKEGFSVAINDPYVGGHITQYLGSLKGLQNIQVEINRRLYLNETTRELLPHAKTEFAPKLNRAITNLIQEFI